MIVIKAITIGLFLLATESVADVCTGRWNGDQVPNPSDCGSFYVCDYGEPKLFKCLDSLLYDPVKRVCNWAYMVNCGQTGNQIYVPILPDPPYYPDPQPYPPQPYPDPQYPPYNPNINPIYPPYNPEPEPIYPPSIMPEYSETDEFFPGLIETIPNVFHCTNPEFYFAPHPRSCEMYFICENYRIHYHQCGEGIYWDYVYNQCDFPEKTFCYSGGRTTTSTTTQPPTVVPEKGNMIECPSGTQSFIGDPDDCHKYYICIGGIPIATSCPERMAWDKDMLQCNEDAWQQCFG